MSDDYLDEVRQRRKRCLDLVRRIPIAALIWGPAPGTDSPVAEARLLLREELRRNGHVAHFSEDLYDPEQPFSLQVQQAADVEAHDIVFSLPDSYGSVAESHDFFTLPGISRKIVTFLDNRWDEGYANKSLIELRSIATAEIVRYDGRDMPMCIIERAMDYVRRLQELHYLTGRRA